jgi:hypothetical protein
MRNLEMTKVLKVSRPKSGEGLNLACFCMRIEVGFAMQTNRLISVNPEIGRKADNEFAAKAMHKALSANMRHAKASARRIWSTNSTCVGKSGRESCCSCRKLGVQRCGASL